MRFIFNNQMTKGFGKNLSPSLAEKWDFCCPPGFLIIKQKKGQQGHKFDGVGLENQYFMHIELLYY